MLQQLVLLENRQVGKTRDSWRKAIRIVCIARHAKNCKVIESCNGNYCNNPLCHKSGDLVDLVIDEIDNNRFNNDPDNEQLLCHSCNQKKSPKHLKPKRNTGYMGERDHLLRDGDGLVDEGIRQRAIENNPQMAISEDLKAVYRSLLRQKVKRAEGCTVKEAIYGLALILDISSVTTTRMLKVLVDSEDGIYEKKKIGKPQANGVMKAFTYVIFRAQIKESEDELDKITGPAIRAMPVVAKPTHETAPLQPTVMPLLKPKDQPDYIQ